MQEGKRKKRVLQASRSAPGLRRGGSKPPPYGENAYKVQNLCNPVGVGASTTRDQQSKASLGAVPAACMPSSVGFAATFPTGEG